MEPRIHQLYYNPVKFAAREMNKTEGSNTTEFKEVFKQAEGIKVSKHAEERLASRAISITEKQWDSINEKVGEARKKGITDSLVVTEEAALLVSVKNNTVVTALDRQEASNKIFTNINGTIIIED